MNANERFGPAARRAFASLPVSRPSERQRWIKEIDSMGRHTKAVADFWTTMRDAAARQREFEAWAATLPDDERRTLFRVFAKRRQAAIDANRQFIPGRPDYLRNLTCGARTASRQSCRMTALFPNGRCIWHGGKSTGPVTIEGKARALENLKLGRLKRGKSRD